MGGILLSFFFYFLYSFFHASAFPKRTTESFIIRYLEDRRIVPVRVELDSKKQTERITSSSGQTLYDFNQGKVAFKDSNSGQCFIADIEEESLEGDRRRLENMQHGVVRGFYLPTFIIQEELSNNSNLLKSFGTILSQFCYGNAVLLVKHTHRKKRATSTGKDQFTHHSYGHYGHQSNNYAHYGHETYVTGTADRNGQMQGHRVNQQVRSESSHMHPRPSYENDRQNSAADSKMNIDTPKTQFQTQYQVPSNQQTFGNSAKNSGTGGSGQFSLRSTHEGGYQLNLPSGLQAGNAYRGGVRSAGQYGIGGSYPQLTEHQKYPDSIQSTVYQTRDQINGRQLLPHAPRPSYFPRQTDSISEYDQMRVDGETAGTTIPHYRGLIQSRQTFSKIPGADTSSLSQPGIQIPIASSIAGDRHTVTPTGAHIFDSQTDSKTLSSRDRRPSNVDYEAQYRKHFDHRPISNGQLSTSNIDHRVSQTILLRPGVLQQQNASAAGTHVPTLKPQTIDSSSHSVGSTIQRPFALPGQALRTIPSTAQSVAGISRPIYQTSSLQPSRLLPHQEYIPGSLIPGQQNLQSPDAQYPTGYITNDGTQERPKVPKLQTPITYSSLPSAISPGDVSQIPSSESSLTSSGTPHLTLRGNGESVRNGIRYPQMHTGIREEYSKSDTYPSRSRLPTDSQRMQFIRTHPVESQFSLTRTDSVPPESIRDQIATTQRQGEPLPDTRHDSSISSGGTTFDRAIQTGRRIVNGHNGFGTSRVLGQDSASSQTQIQTGSEGTAAKAFSSGHYRGLGSQTQVQGGYVGNGSFSAQAQSGFTGGVVQSQIQGSKQGGLSGSSAQVARIGSAQSQVQIGQPSQAASSIAQGKFMGGITQVQAQSSKTGGSAGAQSQSTGLSSSHVQVNVGGKDTSEDERFQGMVSASVHGGYSSGQSQTQLQGGYNSGRNYAATAQGGFDSSVGYQASEIPIDSLINLSNLTVDRHQFSTTGGQKPSSSTGDQHLIPSLPASRVDADSRTIRLNSRREIAGTDIYRHPPRTVPGRTFETCGLPLHETHLSKTPPQQISTPPNSQTDLTAKHPSPHLMPPSQTFDHAYPDLTRTPSHRTNGNFIPANHDTRQGRYNESGFIPSDISLGSQLRGISRTFESHSQSSTFLPGTQESDLDISGLKPKSQIATHPLSPDHAFPSLPDQRIPGSYPHVISPPSSPSSSHQHHQRTTLDSRYGPSYPEGVIPHLQYPSLPAHQTAGLRPSLEQGLQTGLHYPVSRFPDQSHISVPHSQMLPSHKPPDEIQDLMRPDAGHYTNFRTSHLQPQIPSQPQIQPGQSRTLLPKPEIYPQQPQISLPSQHIYPDYPQRLIHSPQIQPEQHRILSPRPQIQPEAPHISSPRPQISTTTEKAPVPVTTSQISEKKEERVPGVLEPDTRECCAALRDLKRRCCSRTAKQDATSQCCRSSGGDIFDFSSDGDLDESKEPCRVVKAICYIVYKPAGKARVCKPTATTAC